MTRGAYFRSMRGFLLALVAAGLVVIAPSAVNWAIRGRDSVTERKAAEAAMVRRYLHTTQIHAIERPADPLPQNRVHLLDWLGTD